MHISLYSKSWIILFFFFRFCFFEKKVWPWSRNFKSLKNIFVFSVVDGWWWQPNQWQQRNQKKFSRCTVAASTTKWPHLTPKVQRWPQWRPWWPTRISSPPNCTSSRPPTRHPRVPLAQETKAEAILITGTTKKEKHLPLTAPFTIIQAPNY